jgi:hypothetical protein
LLFGTNYSILNSRPSIPSESAAPDVIQRRWGRQESIESYPVCYGERIRYGNR